jgi:hypothetical protein
MRMTVVLTNKKQIEEENMHHYTNILSGELITSDTKFKSSFYGGCHLSEEEVDSNGFWRDDAQSIYNVPLWLQWMPRDPHFSGKAYRPEKPVQDEKSWRKLFPFPFDLIPQKGERLIPLSIHQGDACDSSEVVKEAFKRKLFNGRMVEFAMEKFCAHDDVNILWEHIPEQDKTTLISESRQKLAELEEKLMLLKSQGVSGVCNLNILAFWKEHSELRKIFLENNPEADSKFLGFAAEDGVSSTICPESPVYLELVRSQAREIVKNCPSLDYLQLTIDDNGGYIRCANPAHDHAEYNSNSEIQIKKSIELINAFYEAANEVRPVKLLCRCWCATFWFTDEDLWKRFGHMLPQKDFIISGKLNAPPVVDWSPQSPQLNPGIKLWKQGCYYCYWGETSGMKNNFPLHYLYVNPEQIVKDMRVVAKNNHTAVIITQADNTITSELDSLTLRACSWNPDFDLAELKTKWAKLRFDKAADKMLEALDKTPALLKKMTLYHEGYTSTGSLHLGVWGGIRNAESFFFTPIPDWLAGVNEDNLEQVQARINPVPAAQKILETIKEAEKLEPENELLKLYLDQAQMSLQLAHFYKGYHSAFIYYRLAGKTATDSGLHLKEAAEYIDKAEKAMYEYDKNLSLCWGSMTRRRYLVFNGLYSCKILRNFLKLQAKNV